MTVAELIKALEAMPQDALVVDWSDDLDAFQEIEEAIAHTGFVVGSGTTDDVLMVFLS